MKEVRALGEVDRTVHEPARLMLLALLSAVDSADFSFLKNQSGLTKGNLSFHLTKLGDEGFVAVQKEFVEKVPRTTLSLTDQGRHALADHLDVLAAFLSVMGGG
jgi:DNA-binding transcriptional ArsR family regulator